MYEAIFQAPHQTISFVNNFLADLQHIPKVNMTVSMSARAARTQRLLASGTDTVKVNGDGAVARSRRAKLWLHYVEMRMATTWGLRQCSTKVSLIQQS